MQIGEVWEIDGMFPATGTGTWYIVDIDGVEYYYGREDILDSVNNYYDKYTSYGCSIVDDSYELANGIKVGMNEAEILEQFPYMTVIEDFSGTYVYNEVMGFWSEGWIVTGIMREKIIIGQISLIMSWWLTLL